MKMQENYRDMVDREYILAPEYYRQEFIDSINKRVVVQGMWPTEALLAGGGGVDARIGVIHSFTTTAANEHDLNQAGHALHGDGALIFADAGDRGAEKRDELKHVRADWHIAERSGTLQALKKHPSINKVRIRTEYLKACVRAEVVHPFRIINYQLGFVKARYRGLKKNDGKLAMLFALVNVVRFDQMLRGRG